jgi:DNA repair protein RadC
MSTLFVREGDAYREATHDQVLDAVEAALARRFRVGSPVLKDPSSVRDYLRVHLSGLPYEAFGCLYLNSKNRLIALEEVSRGTIDGTSVHPREIVRNCITHNAAALIVYHNHPSGETSPSAPDENITRLIGEAVRLIDVRLIDHWIFGASTLSFAEQGLL